MLRSNIDTPFSFSFNFDLPLPSNDILKRGIVELSYLFQLEDSTATGSNSTHGPTLYPASRKREIFKALFWMAVSITIPLLLL